MLRFSGCILRAISRSAAQPAGPCEAAVSQWLRSNVAAASQAQGLSTTATLLSDAASSSGSPQLPVLAACILERIPVVVRPDPEYEVEYRSWANEHNNQHRKAYTGEFAEIKKAADVDVEVEDYDRYTAEIEQAENPDWRSPWRRLDQRIFMLVKLKGAAQQQQAGAGDAWAFPTVEHQEGESIRAAAERALSSAVEEGAQIHFLGNGPAGHFVTPQGTLFFLRAQLIKGDVALSKAGPMYADMALAAKDELPQFISDPQLQKLLQEML